MPTRRALSVLKRIIEREKAPETHLVTTLGFWIAIIPPLTIGIGLAIYAGIQDDKVWSFTSEGYNNFLVAFKLPIGVMGLSIPLGALAASVHRSVQTSRQIVEQNQQNIFTNYLEHRKYFLTFIEEHQPFKLLEVSAPVLYQNLFPNSANGDLSPDNKSIDRLIEAVEISAYFSSKAITNDLSETNFRIIDDQLEKYLRASTELLNQFIEIKDFSQESIRLDPLNALKRTLNQNLDGVKGLSYCANFHKNFRKNDNFWDLERETLYCEEKILSLQKLYNLWLMISAEISNNRSSNPDLPMGRRLNNVKNNMESNGLKLKDLKILFEHHLSENEREIVINNGPDAWKTLFMEPKT